MPIDAAVLVATAIGFVSGLLINLQEITLDYLINKVWVGWQIALKKIAFSVSSLSLVFGLGAFLLINWPPAQALGVAAEEVVSFFLKIGIFIGIATPISAQIRNAIAPNDAEAS